MVGGTGRVQTADPIIKSDMLYQLSYSPPRYKNTQAANVHTYMCYDNKNLMWTPRIKYAINTRPMKYKTTHLANLFLSIFVLVHSDHPDMIPFLTDHYEVTILSGSDLLVRHDHPLRVALDVKKIDRQAEFYVVNGETDSQALQIAKSRLCGKRLSK